MDINLKKHNFLVPIVDTDAVTICKSDMAEFSQEEIDTLTKEINALTDELINWDFEFYIPKIIAVKAKNYVLYDGKKVKIKGSSLKASTKSVAMREFIASIIDSIVTDKYNYHEIYMKYVKEILTIDSPEKIHRYSARKTITDKIFTSERTNETKVADAIEGEDMSEGDRIYVYYKADDSLSLVQNFDGDYNKKRLLKNLFDTAKCFSTIIPIETFVNYSLKKNQTALETL